MEETSGGALFTYKRRLEREMAHGSVQRLQWSLYQTLVMKKELSQRTDLSIYRLIYVLRLTYDHDV